MKLTGQSLIDAFRSFCCNHSELEIVLPGETKEWIAGIWARRPDWVARCSKCLEDSHLFEGYFQAKDHKVVQRAVILEALKELQS